MSNTDKNNKENRILTIPNVLSVCRILLIPVFIWAYCVKEESYLALAILVISGLTDIVDGYIARHFNLITALGKALDPIADKLTQAAVLLCLASRFRIMFYLAILLILKEVISGCMSLSVIHKTKEVNGADWHGKINTCLLYLTMIIHILWINIPDVVSIILVMACVLMMLISFALYFKRNILAIKKV